MTAKIADRVKETSTTTGTGTLNLDGAASGFQTFVAGIGTGNACYYCISGGAEWEVGIGTVTDATPDTLSRTTILASSNSGSAVSLSAGTKDVFCTGAADAFTLGGVVQIGTTTLGSDNATLASFTSIPGIYNDLRLVIVGRTDQTTGQVAGVQFNADAGANYTYQQIYNNSASTLTGSGAVSQSIGFAIFLASATANAAAVSQVVVEIPNYIGTTFQKFWLSRGSQLNTADGTGELTELFVSGRWKNTAAITRVDVLVATGNFKAGSYCTLYGIGRH